MTEHTPGPWAVEYIDRDYWELYAVDNDLALADIHGTGDGDTDAANARLIAAAPELLEACESVKAWMLEVRSDAIMDEEPMAASCPFCYSDEPGSAGSVDIEDHWSTCPWPQVLTAIRKATEPQP